MQRTILALRMVCGWILTCGRGEWHGALVWSLCCWTSGGERGKRVGGWVGRGRRRRGRRRCGGRTRGVSRIGRPCRRTRRRHWDLKFCETRGLIDLALVAKWGKQRQRKDASGQIMMLYISGRGWQLECSRRCLAARRRIPKPRALEKGRGRMAARCGRSWATQRKWKVVCFLYVQYTRYPRKRMKEEIYAITRIRTARGTPGTKLWLRLWELMTGPSQSKSKNRFRSMMRTNHPHVSRSERAERGQRDVGSK
jgi:hypothetical protein